MATVYSDSRWNSEGKVGWRIRVDYDSSTATAYVDVVQQGTTGGSIWLKFTSGENTFSKSADTYYYSNNGTSANLLGTMSISPSSSYTITQTCSGSTWGGTVNGTSTATVPTQIVNPVIAGTVTNTSTVGSVQYSASVTTPGSGSITGYSWVIDGHTSTNQSGTMSSVTPNANINWSVAATTSDGGSGTSSGYLATKHTPPSLSGGTWTDGARSSNKYTGTLSYNRTYYSDAGFYTHSLVYGTSTSYGTTATDPGSGTT